MVHSPAGRAPATRSFVVALMILVLAVAGSLWWRDYQSQFVYGVEVDGSFLGYVAARDDWKGALEAAAAAAEAEMGLPVVLRSEVTLTRTRLVPEQVVLSGDALVEACRAMVRFMSQAWAVSVDGRDVAFLRTEGEARQVAAGLVDDYRASLLAKGNTEVLDVAICETVEFRVTEARVQDIVDVERAKRILLRGTDRLEIHVVSRGESLWSIADSNDLSLSDLRKANPELGKSDLIRIGQELNLIVPDPYVNLESTERYTYIRYLPFTEQVRQDASLWPWESFVQKAGVRGRRQVTVEIDRLNGDETGRRTIGEKHLSDPQTQIFVMGVKTQPTRAGGLVWPAVGRITSPYGWRGREFHHGVDMGAPYGAPVAAVRGGTVTFAGWRGGYGNLVIIDHGDGMESYYAHLSSIAVKSGQSVSQAQTIGKVGNTGRSYGAHLHLEIRINGKPVNPINHYPRGG